MKKITPYLIIAVLAIGLVFSIRGCIDRKLRETVIIQGATTGLDSGRIWHDRFNREHRRAEAATADRKTLTLAYGKLIDSVARINDQKAKEIEQIVWLSTARSGSRSFPVLNTRIDDHTGVSFGYADNWVNLRGSGNIYGDSLSAILLDYTLRDSLIITTIRKRSGLFRKSTYVDVSSANPDMHIAGLRSLQVREKAKPWGIGLQLGMRYSFASGWAPYAGLGISYNLIRF